MDNLRIEILRYDNLSAADNQSAKEVDHIAFASDPDHPDPHTWSSSDWLVIGRVDGKIVSIVGMLVREALVGDLPVKLGGIGGVATLPDYRSRGLASALLRESTRFLRDVLKVDFGLLVCEEARIPFYGKLGWQAVPGPLVFDQPGGKITWNEPVMVLPVLKTDWPAGTIDLCGLPW
jgi:GNAT superfamily N-acetyltransferase